MLHQLIRAQLRRCFSTSAKYQYKIKFSGEAYKRLSDSVMTNLCKDIRHTIEHVGSSVVRNDSYVHKHCEIEKVTMSMGANTDKSYFNNYNYTIVVHVNTKDRITPKTVTMLTTEADKMFNTCEQYPVVSLLNFHMTLLAKYSSGANCFDICTSLTSIRYDATLEIAPHMSEPEKFTSMVHTPGKRPFKILESDRARLTVYHLINRFCKKDGAFMWLCNQWIATTSTRKFFIYEEH